MLGQAHCCTAFFNSAMSAGVRALPARLAKRVISYATVPMLALRLATTPSMEPALIDVISRYPSVRSMMTLLSTPSD